MGRENEWLIYSVSCWANMHKFPSAEIRLKDLARTKRALVLTIFCKSRKAHLTAKHGTIKDSTLPSKTPEVTEQCPKSNDQLTQISGFLIISLGKFLISRLDYLIPLSGATSMYSWICWGFWTVLAEGCCALQKLGQGQEQCIEKFGLRGFFLDEVVRKGRPTRITVETEIMRGMSEGCCTVYFFPLSKKLR